jgi:hypothetical protein
MVRVKIESNKTGDCGKVYEESKGYKEMKGVYDCIGYVGK